jgi:peptide/nickel transport system ATP-binding protein
MAEPPLFEMRGVTHAYRGAAGGIEAVSLAIPRGATLALMGTSGSGKSTLARIATGLIAPQAGELRFAGTALPRGIWPRAVRQRINMVFQDPAGSLDPRWAAGRSIAEPLRAFGLRKGRAAVAARVAELLAAVGLPADAAARRPAAFSLGQVQRLAIARAVASEPAFLVCDEPTSALDVSVQAQVLNLLRDLQARLGLTMLFISHDPGVVRFMADRVAVLEAGRVVESGPADALFAAPRHPATRRLLAA